jgi:branched-chain amino acid transport system permease protein
LDLLEQLIAGLTLGGIYALIAVGFSMVYGVIRLWNFPHKDMLTWGAFMSITYVNLGVPFYLALILSMFSVATIGVVFLDYLAYRPIRGGPRLSLIITAIGCSIFLSNLARLIWGGRVQPFPHHAIPEFYKTTIISEPHISGLHLFIWGATIIMCVSLYLVVQYTKTGTAMRALAQDQVAASLMGININGTISFTFAIGTAMGALAGLLMALQYGVVHPLMGFFPGIKGFASTVLGGIGNIPGAMIGGIIIGVVESLAAGYLHAGYKDVVAYGLMILIICLRPQGLFGKATAVQTIEEKWLGPTIVKVGRIRENIAQMVAPLKDSLVVFLTQRSRLVLTVSIAVVALLPLLVGGHALYIAVLIMLYMVLAVGLNIVPGFCGLLDLGFVGFYAIGAYTSALLTVHLNMSYWLVIPLAALNGAIWGILLGAPTLRLTGDYFAIVTFGFSEMVVLFITNEMWLTGGTRGIVGILPPVLDLTFLHPPTVYWLLVFAGVMLVTTAYLAWRRRDRRYILTFVALAVTCATISVSSLGFGSDRLPDSFTFLSTESFYYLILAILILTVFTAYRLHNSRVGRAWTAIREDFIAAESCGINLLYYKVLAFAISASFGAIAGSFFARWFMFVSPVMFRFWESFLILCMIVLGGAGSIPGVILGAAILVSLGEGLRAFLPMVGIAAEVRYAIYGIIMISIIRFSPRGLIPVGWMRRETLAEAKRLR